ncbi:transglutaminase family protein [Waterburya agarophytonicola K14]|uniref:Transglutaminase family protein n=1 Tax=Waterburya agarophytonicola KI4 TaxID=2874699 RepID=A0A964BL74_9CYAN|nr:transglutaminase-like domain-containing protein [Waterburya agarophytonicola]MCC0175429.1 transglutaminase family protein [Waterburya agarophytonicola KI4]
MDNQLLWHDFYQEINQPDEQIDLAKASLCYAQAEYPDLDLQKYLSFLDAIASEVQSQLAGETYPLKVIKTINFELFDGLGFQGNLRRYYEAENSFLNRVIERRVGIPITLSVIYLAVAQRINFPMVGIGMPGHFLIRPDFEEVGIFVDAFSQGEILFEQDCQRKLSKIYQQPVQLKQNWLVPVSNKQILARMLNNLKFIYLHQRQVNKALAIMSGIIKMFPDNSEEIRDRGLLYYQTNRWQEALIDLEYFLKIAPDSDDAETIRLLLEKINQVS